MIELEHSAISPRRVLLMLIAAGVIYCLYRLLAPWLSAVLNVIEDGMR